MCSRSHRYPIEDGVIRFLEDRDTFYEGRYVRHIKHMPGGNPIKDWFFFHLVQGGILGELRNECDPGCRVLDLGCAGGIGWLGPHAKAIGIDLSISSLKVAAAHYEFALQASIDNLPVMDSSIDVAYSSFLFEHLHAPLKERALGEIRRVLVPQGRLIIQLDTLSTNRFMVRARRDPDAYRRAFIEHDQHHGLEPLDVLLQRLEAHGFSIVRCTRFGTTRLQYPAVYDWLVNAYGGDSRAVRWLGRSKRTLLRGPLYQAFDFLVTAFYRCINSFTRNEMATGAIVVAQAGPAG